MDIKERYRNYLEFYGYKIESPSGDESTVDQYVSRVRGIINDEKISWEEAKINIDELIKLYDRGGEKEHLGMKSHRKPISALKTFESFVKFKPLLVVDMFSGGYNLYETGHEYLNDKMNDDGFYYGYVPPHGYAKINRLGSMDTDEQIEGVLVVFVQAISESNTSRKITGFYPRATVYNKAISGKYKNRSFYDQKAKIEKEPPFSIISETYVKSQKDFIIHNSDYDMRMFRSQKIYQKYFIDNKDKVGILEKEIREFVDATLDNIEDDQINQQLSVQRADVISKEQQTKAPEKQLVIVKNPETRSLSRNPSYVKKALIDTNYTCQIDSAHQTFLTRSGEQFMEGHHLIPYTIKNAKNIWERFEKKYRLC